MVRRSFPKLALGLGLTAAVAIAFVALGMLSGDETPESNRLRDASKDGSPSAGYAGALQVHWTRWNESAGRWDSDLTPLDAVTAQPIEGSTAVSIPHGPISPDGRLMGFSERNLGVPSKSEVEVAIVDLESWQVVRTIETAPGVGAGVWSADGERMYVWRDHCGLPADRGYCDQAWQRGLWELDIDAGTGREVVAYDFSVLKHEVSAAADRAYALAIRTEVCCGIDPEGDAFVAVIDIVAGEVIGEIPIPGMFAGQPGHVLGDTTMFGSYHPAVALSEDGASLYVVDPVDDRVHVVDTAGMAVTGAIDFAEKGSALSRFADWLAGPLLGTAEAKGNPSYSRSAEITPDGRYLLISGIQAHKETGNGGNLGWTDRPAGLVVVELATREVVFREAGIGWIRLSPDGRWALATGQYLDEALADENGNGGLVAFGLKIIDLQTLDVVAHAWEGQEVAIPAVSPDSRYGYVVTDGPGMAAFRQALAPAKCGPECRIVHVIDLARNEVIATRTLAEDEGILPLDAWP